MNLPFTRIFVVEDDKLIAETLGLILKQSGYIVSTYADAESALECIAKRAPNLVLTDVFLSGEMTGIELAKRLADTSPHVSVLLMSGRAYTPESLDQWITRHNACKVYANPISPRWLLGEVARVLTSVSA